MNATVYGRPFVGSLTKCSVGLAVVGALFLILRSVLMLFVHFYPPEQRLRLTFEALDTACRSYRVEYDATPSARDNAALVRMLAGQNPRHVSFLLVLSSQTNNAGELLDPWGTPLRLSCGADAKLRVVSAGPDRKFGTADDIDGESLVERVNGND